jgi:acetyl-CoA carboxylase biotin carboxyl carrier protein
MEWTERQILAALRLIEESDFDEVRLETDGFRLHVRKSGVPARLDAVQSASAPPAAPSCAQLHALSAHADPPAPASAGSPADAEAVVPPGMVAIRAPMIGTFYRAPAPHLPPFVEPGVDVKPDDTVCLIEVMKLFNTLKAGVAGRVAKVLAKNAAPVAKDQVLMIIEPLR